MAQQPRGKPPSQAPPPGGRGRNALTALGGGVLVLAVAGGAWALFGRDDNKSSTTAIGPNVPSASAPGKTVFGPVAPGRTAKPTATVTPTSIGPVAVKPAATATPKPAATQAAVRTPVPTKAPAGPTAAPTAAPTKAPVAAPAVVPAPAVGSQQGGTVAKKAHTFKVARGDTLWNLTKQALSDTGRSTSNANVALYVARVYAHNTGEIGSDPNLIVPGQTIVWPAGL